MSNPKLSKGTIIIVDEDFIIPGTGTTFYFYKGNKYKIVKYLPICHENDGTHAWEIKLIEKIKGDGTPIFWLSEYELFEKFECVKYTRLKKLFAPFAPKKFDIVCHNEQEWNNMQLFLFKKGYYWESSGKRINSEFNWNYPRILKNYRTGDILGSKILIIDSYFYTMQRIKLGYLKNVKTINAISYMRKIKLKKINNI